MLTVPVVIMLRLVLAAYLAAGTMAQAKETLFLQPVHSTDANAVCNDGSAPYFYSAKPRGTSGGHGLKCLPEERCADGTPCPASGVCPSAATADSWMIILESGNPQSIPWCFPPDELLWGSGSLSNCHPFAAALAATPGPAPNMTDPSGGPNCVLSSNCTTNPTFCNFGKIVVPQCTFDNWLGDADQELGNSTHKLTAHYRGQRVLNATLTQIAKDLLRKDSKVLVVGTDGGANFLYIAADRIGALLAVKPSNFAVVPIGGL